MHILNKVFADSLRKLTAARDYGGLNYCSDYENDIALSAINAHYINNEHLKFFENQHIFSDFPPALYKYWLDYSWYVAVKFDKSSIQLSTFL